MAKRCRLVEIDSTFLGIKYAVVFGSLGNVVGG